MGQPGGISTFFGSLGQFCLRSFAGPAENDDEAETEETPIDPLPS
jgi:hypothetical protein